MSDGGRAIISWNVTNWITVLLMVAVAYIVIGGAMSIGRQAMSGDVAAE